MQQSLADLVNTNSLTKFQQSTYLSIGKQRILLSPDKLSPSESETESDKRQPMCRICFQDFRPLISPCQCKGSMRYVHEQCMIQWLVSSHRKKCELCLCNITLYKERLCFKEIIKKTFQYLMEDKKRCLQIFGYALYLWVLKYKLFTLIGFYIRTYFKMSAMKMLKILYNLFILMLVLEVAFEEYGRIKAAVDFFNRISVIIRIKGKDSKSHNKHMLSQ